MPHLLNQFDLKPRITLERFSDAWEAFVACLVDDNLALGATPLSLRVPDSGYDTDEERGHSYMAVISFRDQAQADAAWAAIESGVDPLGRKHRAVIAMVHDPVFTFWKDV